MENTNTNEQLAAIHNELKVIYLDTARIKRNVVFFFWIFILGFLMSFISIMMLMGSMAVAFGG